MDLCSPEALGASSGSVGVCQELVGGSCVPHSSAGSAAGPCCVADGASTAVVAVVCSSQVSLGSFIVAHVSSRLLPSAALLRPARPYLALPYRCAVPGRAGAER